MADTKKLTRLLGELNQINHEFRKQIGRYNDDKDLIIAIDEGLCESPGTDWEIRDKPYNDRLYEKCEEYLRESRKVLDEVEERLAKYKSGDVDHI